jgi:hypothetical protein
MIHEVLPAVVSELNNYLSAKLDTEDNKVIIGNLIGQDGSIKLKEENKVICSLINIERDGTRQLYNPGRNPPVAINLYVIFYTYFAPNNYLEGLKFISGVISFFQSRSSFDASDTPYLPPEADKILFEIENIPWRELGTVFQYLGLKYAPSIVYRVRTLRMEDDTLNPEIPPIGGFDLF